MPILQQQVAFSMLQPPKISGTGTMFQQILSNQQIRSLKRNGAFNRNSPFTLGFMQRINDLFTAAKHMSPDDTLFYIPSQAAVEEIEPEVAGLSTNKMADPTQDPSEPGATPANAPMTGETPTWVDKQGTQQ